MGSDADDNSDPCNWFAETTERVLCELKTDADQGLSRTEAALRLNQVGPNEIREAQRRSPIAMFLGQFSDLMIVVLIVAAIVSGLVGEALDSIAILVILVLNAVIGFVQEYRAERAINALKALAAPAASVCREGASASIPAGELVPGDVCLLEAGDLVPGDLRLIHTAGLQIDESALTGESESVSKQSDPISSPASVLGDQTNMAFKGTQITRGRGRGVVVATGMRTELGQIAGLLSATGDLQTPLQKRLTQFGRRLALAVLAICALLFVSGLVRGEDPTLMFLTAVSLAVAAIPEALPAVITVALGLGAARMVKHHALIRRLAAVETLGSVTYICSDKTGTLTQNRMHAEAFHVSGHLYRDLTEAGLPGMRLGLAMALNNDAEVGDSGAIRGDPTEVALLQAARTVDPDPNGDQTDLARIGELPFESERMMMTTIHRLKSGVVSFTKGAPEAVLPRCITHHGLDTEGDWDTAPILAAAVQLAQDGFRILAFAERAWPTPPDVMDQEALESRMVFLGLVALVDPPRLEAQEAVAMCIKAGIRPVMITGDHPATAQAIAQRLGISSPGDRAITGVELAKWSDPELARQVRDLRVYARVDPAQKIRIVGALQRHGEFVAMTGDGVNDAPALRQADIGVAMGQKGTDVAREAADMVLLDDNFHSIVRAVREGRRIYDNIRKFIRYTMTSNSGEIWTLSLAPLLGLPLPLLPIHILWINLVTDGLPGLALSVEPAERALMKRPPRPPNESVFARGLWQHVMWLGLLIGVLSLGTQALAIHLGSPNWQTMTFTVLTLSQLVHAQVVRSETESIFRLGLRGNLPLLAAVAITILLQLAVIYIPACNQVFKTQPLTAQELSFCLALPLIVLVAGEMEKWAIRRFALFGFRTDGTTSDPAMHP